MFLIFRSPSNHIIQTMGITIHNDAVSTNVYVIAYCNGCPGPNAWRTHPHIVAYGKLGIGMDINAGFNIAAKRINEVPAG